MKILLIGVSTRAMAESALKSFPREKLLTLDYFGDYDQQQQCENYSLKKTFQETFTAKNLLKASRHLSFDIVIYTSNLENYPSLVRKFQGKGLLLGNSPWTLSRVRNPGVLFPFLKRAGILYPETYLQDRGFKEEQKKGRIFLQKPIRSGGGFGVKFLEDVTFCLPGTRKKNQPLIQEYIEGLPGSALFVANGQNSVLIGLTEQLIGCREFGSKAFRYCGNILGKIWKEDKNFHLIIKLEEIITKLTKKFQLKGVNGIDFILKDGIPYLLEVNPRYTAAMELVERAYNLNVMEAHMKSFEGLLPTFNLSEYLERGYWGKAILFAERELAIPSLQKVWFERGIRDIPFEGDILSQGDPICTLFAYGRSREGCYKKLVEKATILKAELSEIN